MQAGEVVWISRFGAEPVIGPAVPALLQETPREGQVKRLKWARQTMLAFSLPAIY
jgi:hypothetical protein